VDVPSRDRAETYLAEAERRNPGPWAGHVRVAARAAEAIAAHHPGLDPEVAYVLGLLHDLGRGQGGAGVPDVRHILDGYAFLRADGFPDAARICLTHSFPVKETGAYAGRWDCPPAERRFVQEYLDATPYTDYDRLIQLCDALALPDGFCLLERRFVDVVLRHGFNDLTLDKWRASLDLRRHFEAVAGTSIYVLLPGVVEHTFGFAAPCGEPPGGPGGPGGPDGPGGPLPPDERRAVVRPPGVAS